ncbi:MAG: transposase [Polyangiaceae bacterium]|nr:transposase [Polyangiaceae bacterium]
MGTKKRRKFTPEFKAEAAELVRSSDKPIAQLAEDLGISEKSLYRWAKQTDVDKKAEPKGQLMTQEREELAKLRKELKQVTMARDFLRKRS